MAHLADERPGWVAPARLNVAAAETSSDALLRAVVALGFVAAIVLKVSLFPLSNTDMTEYVLIWLQASSERGFAVLGDDVTDYAPAYSYLLLAATLLPDWVKPLTAVKLVSLGGDVALSFVGGMLLRAMGAEPVRAAAGAVLLFALPTVLVNSSVWGQTDAIWAAANLAALLAMLRGRPALAVLLFGFAVAYKPQAAFLGPIVLAFLIARRRLPLLLLLPVPYLLLALPPLLAGRSAASVFGVYFQVFGSLTEVTYDAPGLWSWLELAGVGGEGAILGGLVVAAATGAVITWLALRGAGERLRGEALLHGAALSCALLPFLTPKTMGRYLFGAEVIIALAACLNPLLWPAVIASQVAALLAYQPFLMGLVNWRVPVAVLFEMLAIWMVLRLWLQAGRAPAPAPSVRRRQA